MFHFIDGIMNAAATMKLAIKLLGQHRMAPTPLNYSLCYAYHSGKHPDLVKEIDIALEIQGQICHESAKAIYKEYLSDKSQKKQMQKIHNGTGEEILKIQTETEDLCLNIDDFQLLLQEAIQISEGSNTDADIHPALKTLIEKTSEFDSVIDSYKIEINQCREKIKVLQLENNALQDDSKKDPLTELFNRRIFDLTMSQASFKESEPLTLCFLDVDDFKRVNDTYGHIVGDQVIKTIAQILLEEAPTNATCIRMGGEEFAIIFHGVEPKVAEQLNLKILARIANTEFKQRNSGKSFKVTVSIGQTTLLKNDSKMDFFQRSDELLNKAKKTGKNKLVSD